MPGSSNSIFKIVKESYGSGVLRVFRQYVSAGDIIANHRGHLMFNHECLRRNALPKSLNVRSPVNSYEGIALTRRFGFDCLKLRIRSSHRRIKECESRINELKFFLNQSVSEAHFNCMQSYQKVKIDSKTKRLQELQIKKVEELVKMISRENFRSQTSEKTSWIDNRSSFPLSDKQREVLSLGLNYAVAPKSIPTERILAAVESSVYKLAKGEADLVRGKVVSCIKNHKKQDCSMTREEMKAINELKEKVGKEICVLNADKGNVTVVLDKTEYDEKLENLLADDSTYCKLKRDPTKTTEKKLNSFISNLVAAKKLTNLDSFKLKSSDSSAAKLYGLPKIHKENCPLRPIVSFVGSPTYALAKEISSLLSPLVGTLPYHVKNSECFVKDLDQLKIENDEIMASFDVISLFTKIPVDLSLEIIERRLTEDGKLHERSNLEVTDVLEGLRICLQDTNFSYKNDHYKQIYGTAMGSPVSVVVAEMVMEDVESRALSSFSHPPRLWKRYIDDTFLIIKRNHFTSFFNHINGIEESIKFTHEVESNNCIAFLDVNLKRQPNGYIFSSVFRKPTHSNRYLNFRSNHPIEHKRSVVRTLLDRAEKLTTTKKDRKREIIHVKNTLALNDYPQTFVEQIARSKGRRKPTETTEFIGTAVLPYEPGLGEKLKRILKPHGIRTYFKPPTKIGQMLPPPKDRTQVELRKGVVYQIECGGCDLSYIGETKRNLTSRRKEHIRDSNHRDPTKTALSKHLTETSHDADWHNAKIIQFESNYHKRLFLESYHINNTPHSMNDKRTVKFPPVYTTLLNK